MARRPGRSALLLASAALPALVARAGIQYQKRIRLHEARLLVVDRTHDVATVGYLVGYDSTSQFSREYRRQFGVPPGRDAERLRRSTA